MALAASCRSFGGVEIRPAVVADLPVLQAIEVAAGAAFVDVGRPEIAQDEPFPIEDLLAYLEAARCWVAADDDGPPVAYVVVDLLDDDAHVEQVSVHPDAGGQGLGARLLDHVSHWAAGRGHDRVTLTTFTDVPWNAPYYERLGFRSLRDDELGPALRRRMDEEHDHGLLRHERVAMARSTLTLD